VETIAVALFLLLAVVVSGALARMSPVALPLPLVQIALGAFIAAVANLGVKLQPDPFFLLFLPPLLFLDGWRIPKEGLFRDKGTIGELALGLVVFTVVGVGYFINWMIPAMPLAVAFALAAIVSPTDSTAVSAIAIRVPIPKRLMHILDGESLLNDASGLVCMRFAIAAALTGTFSLLDAVGTFLWLAIGGIAIGVGVTWIASAAKNWVSRHFGEETGSQILISLLIPFGAYLLAEHLALLRHTRRRRGWHHHELCRTERPSTSHHPGSSHRGLGPCSVHRQRHYLRLAWRAASAARHRCRAGCA
jgi:CPA1 family monovalent cation:H+ antiporter